MAWQGKAGGQRTPVLLLCRSGKAGLGPAAPGTESKGVHCSTVPLGAASPLRPCAASTGRPRLACASTVHYRKNSCQRNAGVRWRLFLPMIDTGPSAQQAPCGQALAGPAPPRWQGAVPQRRGRAGAMLADLSLHPLSGVTTMAQPSSSPASPSSASPAPASVPADAPGWASSEKPDPALAPRPGAEATAAAPVRAADPPDAIGPGGDSPAQLPGGVVDGGSSSGREAVNFDDDGMYSGRGNGAASGGTANAQGGDSGRLGPPSEQLSPHNQPSERKS